MRNLSTKFSFYSLVLLFMVLASCEYHSLEEPSLSNEELITTARRFFKTKVDGVNSPHKNTDNYRVVSPKSLLWESAFVKQLSDGRGVVVPLRFQDPIFLKRGANGPAFLARDLSYLLIREGTNGNMKAELVTFIPEKIGISNGDGVALIEDWNGNFMKGYKYADGTISPITLGKRELNVVRSHSELCVTDWYTCFVVDTHLECYYDYPEYSLCEPGGGGDSGGYGGGGDYGGGGGWDTGGGDDCIQNQLVTPCLFNVAEHALSPQATSSLNSIIQDVFNSDETTNLILVEGGLMNQGRFGETEPSQTGQTLNLNIKLNAPLLITTSQEFIAATIFHEAFHAICSTLGSFTATEEHIVMYSSKLDLLASALQSAYPGISIYDARGLILSGILSDTPGTVKSNNPALAAAIITRMGFSEVSLQLVRDRYIQIISGHGC